MSGGSMDYVYRLVEEISFREDTPTRKAFAKHLKLVATALHDIEWVDSCDKAKGDEEAAILACLPKGALVDQCFEDVKAAAQCLIESIERKDTP